MAAPGGSEAHANPPASRRRRFWPAALLLAAALVWPVAPHPGCRGPEKARPLNIVLVTADTLRADHLPVYGYQRVRTPHLDRMARAGVVFENAQTVAPLTLPAHSSIFTGTYPLHHGVRDNGGYYLQEDEVTLAECLEGAGYATGGFVGAFVLDARWGLNQGFDRYFDDFDLSRYERVGLDTVQRRGGEVLDAALSWMKTIEDRRFFSWIHFYDPHAPYDPPAPFSAEYAGAPTSAYDGEIAYVDHLMGRLFAWLEEEGLADDTVVVFVADHGESLGQHGEKTHGFYVYDATMRVPFLMTTPYRHNVRGARVSAQVRTIDVMPTLLELAGVDPPAAVQGRSLVPLLDGTTNDLGLVAYGESLYPRNHFGWSELRSLRGPADHYIAAPRPELFDPREDPREETNVADARSSRVRELDDQLRQIENELSVEGIDEQRPQTLDPEVQARLAALGYIGNPGRVTLAPDRPLADPKDKIHLFNAIKDAGAASSGGRLEEAKATIEEVLAEDPAIVEAHHILANLHAREGNDAAALAGYQEALARDPEYKPALVGLATTYRSMERPDDAAAGFRRLLELDPRDNRAYFLLAQMHVEEEEYRPALELLRQAAHLGSERAPLHNLMAECHIGLNELVEAEAEIARALALSPRLPTARYNLALIHEERGHLPRAIAAYEKELTIAPKSYKAHFNLAKLYGRARRPGDMARHLERSIELDESFAEGHLYLAKIHLDRSELGRAEELALRGIALGPEPEVAPLGHYILADVYNRLGRLAEAEQALRAARALEGS